MVLCANNLFARFRFKPSLFSKTVHNDPSSNNLKTKNALKLADFANPKTTPIDYEIVRNGSQAQFEEIVYKIATEELWDNNNFDYADWLGTFGEKNFAIYFAIDKATGSVLGSISVGQYSGDQCADGIPFFVISFYYVHPKARRFQIGHKLFEKALTEVGESRVFGYAVDVMSAKYVRQYGHGKHNLLDWELLLYFGEPKDIRLCQLSRDPTIKILNWQSVDFEAICRFDNSLSAPVDRRNYLQRALRHPGSLTKVALNANAEVIGTCQVRPVLANRISVVLFYANSPEIAESLLQVALSDFRPKFGTFSQIVYKCPSSNTASIELFCHKMFTTNAHIEVHHARPQFIGNAIDCFPVKLLFSLCDCHCSVI
uniref:N-acetyltransferase domain-containing protein n=1 Tax=Globodera pallida TaxID=36090 RepID=A0A183BXY3_GLOPA